MTNYVATVPVTFTKDGKEQTSFRRVGAAFENVKKATGETFISVKLDFPVAVAELVLFQAKPKGSEEDVTE